VNSWLRSACYPRRTFYPLSDGPSTQNHRITRSHFRACSTCVSRSQPGLCSCTPRRVSNPPEPSFERLRYIWEATAPVKLPVWPCPPPRLGSQVRATELSGWYFTVASPPSRNQRIPGSHLSYAGSTVNHDQSAVKVHGVFPSRCGHPASSPEPQIRRAVGQDSRSIGTPFVQVGTYPTRNFATLGPL
jgi:hypothetical protein